MSDDKSELLNALRIERAPDPTERSRTWPAAAAIALCLALVGAGAWWYLDRQVPVVHVAVASMMPAGTPSGSPGTLLDATGYVVARREATVGPKISGKLRDVLVEEGMHVEKGQILAHLDEANAAVALDEAKANLLQADTAAANAKPIFDRKRSAVVKDLITREDFDNAKSTFDQTQTAVAVARAQLAVAQQNLDDTVVEAPFAGVVTVKAAQAGEIISPVSAGAGFTRTGIATIVDMDSLEVEIDVSENFINRVTPNQPCTITLNAYPDWKIPGHVIAIIPTADRSKATVKVRVAFDTKDSRVLPEMGAHVAFLSDAKESASVPVPSGIVIPAEAVVPGEATPVVYVVRDGRIERRAVKLGQRTAQGQIVLSGLSSGDTVAIDDLGQLADATTVKIAQ
ncbi:MAG TPA: efflux RND transporter periplasmic adaptor subunit [Bradyrhizobium sp.]|nr:efflux RND transporter periplasmic adaptor subunit [Bradyrhizobium sp.]